MMMGGMQQSQSPIAKVLTRTLTVTLPPIGYNPNPNLNPMMVPHYEGPRYGGPVRRYACNSCRPIIGKQYLVKAPATSFDGHKSVLCLCRSILCRVTALNRQR